jgi:hypothetical protein
MTKTTTSYVKLVRDEHGTIIDSENADHLVRAPLTYEQRIDIRRRWIDGNGTASELIDMVEVAHRITAKD